MNLESVVLALAALVFAAVAVQGLFIPRRIVEPLGASLVSPSFANEIRANYGGMHCAIAVLLATGAAKVQYAVPALALLLGFTGGLCVGRLVSWVSDGPPNRFVRVFLVLEAVGAVASGTLLLRR
jgi:hypothetical protein